METSNIKARDLCDHLPSEKLQDPLTVQVGKHLHLLSDLFKLRVSWRLKQNEGSLGVPVEETGYQRHRS